MELEPLKEHTTVIRSGVTPAPKGAGQLSRERAEWLDEQLCGLRAARNRAAVEARSYVVGAGKVSHDA